MYVANLVNHLNFLCRGLIIVVDLICHLLFYSQRYFHALYFRLSSNRAVKTKFLEGVSVNLAFCSQGA